MEDLADRLFNEVTDDQGELKNDWIAAGSNSVVFRSGAVVVKVCLSLPNDHLGTSQESKLAQATWVEAAAVNAEARTFSEYFGGIYLPEYAYTTAVNLPGSTVKKMYTDLGMLHSYKLSPDKLYRDVPVMAIQQPFFSPVSPPIAEAVGFCIGKGDYNHLGNTPDAALYERMNNALLAGGEMPEQLRPSDVYDVQKSESIVYYMKKIRQDDNFRAMLQDFLPRVARYTHETGHMIDVFPVIPNGVFLKHTDTEWSAKFYDMSTKRYFGDVRCLNDSRRKVLSDPADEQLSDAALIRTNMLMSYMRSFNILAVTCGAEPPFNILCENGDPSKPPDCELAGGGWWPVYQRIQRLVDGLYGGRPKPECAGIYASVWNNI